MVIDMTSDEFLFSPSCEHCEEPTKRITGRTFDVEGPGMIGKAYACDNRRCKRLKDLKGAYLLALIRNFPNL